MNGKLETTKVSPKLGHSTIDSCKVYTCTVDRWETTFEGLTKAVGCVIEIETFAFKIVKSFHQLYLGFSEYWMIKLSLWLTNWTGAFPLL